MDNITPPKSGIKEDTKPTKKERDANTDLIEAEVTASLLDNGIGVKVSKKLTELLITNSIMHVSINY